MSKSTTNTLAAPVLVPALGVIGPAAVREAFAGDLRQLQDLLQGAVKKALELGGEDDWWPYVHALFADFIVVEMKDGKLMRYPYRLDGTDVALGTPTEVTISFLPAGESQPTGGTFVEAAGGGKYRIRVIRAGLSLNGNFYPDAVLREAIGLFDGARVFIKSDAEHLAGGGKDVRNIVGRLQDPVFVEGTAPDSGEVQATFELLEPEGDVALKLREAWTRGMTGLFGFSIDAEAMAEKLFREGRQVRAAKRILRINSVDLIVEPGAGGEVIDLLEAQDTLTKGTLMDRTQIIALLEARGLLKGKDSEALSDDALTDMLREAVPQATPESPETAPAVTLEDLRMVEARIMARERIAASALPAKAKDRLTARFAEAKDFTGADIDRAIRDEADYLASFTESGKVAGLGGQRVQITEARFEKTDQMLDAFFDRSHKDHKHARSFKECYIQMTGDSRVTGRVANCDQALMRESLNSASFDDVLGNAIHRRLLADYQVGSQYDIWRNLASVVPVNDFRNNERTRYGGYGDLPVVAESGDYTALASPSDEKASYAVSKRGGTEDLTLEMIKNDDVGAITRLPTKLSNAAKRTLSKFVLDFLATNPVIYDGIALFHASHGNLGTAALDKASLAARRLAMLKQTEPGSNEQLGIGPRYLWVPPEMEETAVDLFRRNTEQDRSFTQSLSLEVMPVWYWTDPNDWFVTADPNEVPVIEVGFLDGNEEPELFIQDNPTSGSMFSNDKVTYKIRHVYGAAAVDFRGAQGSLVA